MRFFLIIRVILFDGLIKSSNRLRMCFYLFFIGGTLFAQDYHFSHILKIDSVTVFRNHVKSFSVKTDSLEIFSVQFSRKEFVNQIKYYSGTSFYVNKSNDDGRLLLSAELASNGDTANFKKYLYNNKGNVLVVTTFQPGLIGLEFGGERLTPATKTDSFFYDHSGQLAEKKSYWGDKLYVTTFSSYINRGIRRDSVHYEIEDAFQVYQAIELYDKSDNLIYRKKQIKDAYDPLVAEIDSFQYMNNLLLRHSHYSTSSNGNSHFIYLYKYDNSGRLISKVQDEKMPNNSFYVYENGRLASQTDVRDGDTTVTKYQYDKSGDITSCLLYKGKIIYSGWQKQFNKKEQFEKYSEISMGNKMLSVQFYYAKNGLPLKAKVKEQGKTYWLRYSYTFF